VVSFTAVTNERSWRVMERIGMRREREFDHPREDLGHLRRHVLYAAP
jgi:RimJ/RimL family protein N-acetyltransferase